MVVMNLIASAVIVGVASAQSRPSGFEPGWNGLAKTPPMGWRSWNAYGARISETAMKASIDALMAKVWTIGGKHNMSLFDSGYISAGIDEGWEGCGQGVNGTQHAANGDPVINSKFPDMAGLVDYGHKAGLKIGWYENGCACGERKALMQNYQGDVRDLHAFGFDGVKLDGCGAQRNMTLYAQLMNETGKSFLIENCHWGRCTDSDDSSCPTLDWCPFNWYRSSGDINSRDPLSWLSNLQSTIRFQDPIHPLSQPGCWAYPDMLEVGRIMVDGKFNYGWNRAHFGAWCIVSSPLILGMDVTETAIVDSVIDVITNEEAIQVNQAWAGHPGTLVWSDLVGSFGYPAARKCNANIPALKQSGWKLQPIPTTDNVVLAAPGGGCLKQQGSGAQGGAGGLVIATCNTSDAAQIFSWDTTTMHLTQVSSKHCVDVHASGPIVWMYGCGGGVNDKLIFNTTSETIEVALGEGLCFGVEAEDPAGGTFASTLQAWAKPLAGNDGVALLLINPDSVPQTFNVPLSVLPQMGNGVNVTTVNLAMRDIWEMKDLSPIMKGKSTVTMTVGGFDSGFYRLSVSNQM